MAESGAQKARLQVSHNLAGESVGRFAIQRLLGTGGMGQVYRAEDTRLKRLVALKRMAPQFSTDEHYRRRFLKEAECASRLSHQFIAGVYDVFEDRGEIFLVMEYVEGETLRQRLKSPLTLDEGIEIGVQCATALVAAQNQGIVHRDLKPENIMLTLSLQVKILDFGVAKALPRADESTTQEAPGSTGGMAGTPAYMAPESLLEKRADGRSDIFSLGVTLYEAFTGQHPFLADSFLNTAQRILHHTPMPANLINPKVSAELARILSKMLNKDPADRYATSADLLVDLRALQRATAAPILTPPPGTFLQDAPFPALSSVSSTAHSGVIEPHKSRHLGIWVSLGLLVALGAAASFLYWPKLRPLLPQRVQAILTPLPNQISPSAGVTNSAADNSSGENSQGDANPNHAGSSVPIPLTSHSGGASDLKRASTAGAISDGLAPTRPKSGSVERGSAPSQGQVNVQTDVAGARAALTAADGKPLEECVTPCLFQNLKSGRYKLDVSKEGYRILHAALTLQSNQVLAESLQLEPQQASLVVKSDPAGAEILINSKLQAALTPATIKLAPGKYGVAVRKDGQTSLQGSVQLKDGDIKGATFQLQKSQAPAADAIGLVQIRSIPPGADILVDGVSIGHQTPFDLKLPAGHHTLTLYLNSYLPLREDLTVEANQTLQLDRVLVKH
ncbi:MAG TPA: serine/threonine-protein kinase [Candidatus Acidoferrales bacterium]|nr:serine/threonine-protein kinase [Candidatus Acidoferrales bacterium]